MSSLRTSGKGVLWGAVVLGAAGWVGMLLEPHMVALQGLGLDPPLGLDLPLLFKGTECDGGAAAANDDGGDGGAGALPSPETFIAAGWKVKA